MRKLNDLIKFVRRQPRWRQITAVVIIVLAGGWWLRGGGEAGAKVPTFAARRGALEINVLEGGSLQALESQEVKCEVRVGYQGTKILRIVEEGYLVTEADVTNGKVLVELDSSDFEKQIAQQEIEYQQAVASLIDAQQDYEIQLNQNQSDIKAAEQKARFARMDFDKFLGDTVTDKIIKDYGLDKILTDASTNNVTLTSHAEEAGLAKVVAPPSVTDPLPAKPASESAGSNLARSASTNLMLAVATNLTALASKPSGTNSNVASAMSVTPVIGAAANLAAGDSTSGTFPTGLIDFTKYADINVLGDGEA